jgi:S-adenosylmethionine:tRNA ribosyltransferase-isomerase
VKIEDLDYELPPELIAQHPPARREDSRLLVVERATGALHDETFASLGRWLEAGDALAINETRVIPARLDTQRRSGGRVELLLVRPEQNGAWRVLAKPAKKAAPGETLTTADGGLALEVIAVGDEGERVVRVVRGDLRAALEAHGEIPLPPYIHRAPEPQDRERYQTVFARERGSVAAPTAGLHFTPALNALLAARGIDIVEITLHVGYGTFQPVRVDLIEEHRMEAEEYTISESAAQAINRARDERRRIIAVGTTTTRTLEAAAAAGNGRVAAGTAATDLFIYPGFAFRLVDGLLTNFHLPRSSLLLLVSAFAGVEPVRAAYAAAIAGGYRFYSYGDAMVVT